MPDGSNIAQTLAVPGSESVSTASSRLPLRHSRAAMIAFVTDTATEQAVSDGVTDVIPGHADVRRGGVRAAIAAMRTTATPSILIVDIAGEERPLELLSELASVVEPDACVLVIGDVDSAEFYREITRGLGANEYLPKPVTANKVSRHITAITAGQALGGEVQAGGFVVLTGVRGGVGATTIAVNLAGHLGVTLRRHTVLLDPDLYSGDASFMLNVTPGPGLRTALEAPERIDALLAERAAQPAAERLHVLAGEDIPGDRPVYSPAGPSQLVAALRRRYNFIVADVPPRQDRLILDLLAEQHQRVLVIAPTLASVRAVLRLMPTSGPGEKAKRPIVVLNRVGVPGGMARRAIEDALGFKVDVAIPDQPRKVGAAAMMGELAMDGRSGIRNGIVELARRIGSGGIVTPTLGATPVPAKRGLVRRLFRRGT
jgi:pilus assembly protein CpaE